MMRYEHPRVASSIHGSCIYHYAICFTVLQTTFKVQVSYYEIYKEKIFDLLASTKHKSKTKVANFDYGIEKSR